ncbi:peptidase [Malassezia pachydermatis]|uniref:Protease iv n=1 Tax=Malassezia pachydermatis TaxID=77020 RepID=A0A0M8MQZ3_9BASI|nr:protease iv [Malassezia pachydermatis]KOS15057.1 protease iv [Malassezia pachydermatis]
MWKAITALSQSRIGRGVSTVWSYRKPIVVCVVLTGVSSSMIASYTMQRKMEHVNDDTYLTWRVHPGAIVDVRGPTSVTQLLSPMTLGDEPVRVMEMHEVLRTLRHAQHDKRVRGLVADFSVLHVPRSVRQTPLGPAQVEELVHALRAFQEAKKQQFPDDERPTTVAWADTFDAQSMYLLASTFDRVYMQPSGMVPLIGVGKTFPFVRRVLDWLGIHARTEAREEYKSMVSTFVQDEFPPAQLQNMSELYGDLQQNAARMLGEHRFRDVENSAAKVYELMQHGPYTAREALAAGLIDALVHREDVTPSLQKGVHRKTFPLYAQICARQAARQRSRTQPKIGVAYLEGTMHRQSQAGSVSEVIRALRALAENDEVEAMVLRINSGGGEVIASETLWAAMQHVRQETKKPIVASFGNVAASGAYYAATAADAIFASENTVMGSIGVAVARPFLSRAVLDALRISMQSVYAGSTGASVLYDIDAHQAARMKKHADESYADFLDKVQEGRGMHATVLSQLAGGRVMTGLTAWRQCVPDAGAFILPPTYRPHRAPPLSTEPCTAWTVVHEEREASVPLAHVQRKDQGENDDAYVEGEDTEALVQRDLEAHARCTSAQAPASHGRGLIDAIGGLDDAIAYAHALAQERAGTAPVSSNDEIQLVRLPTRVPLWRHMATAWAGGEMDMKADSPWDTLSLWAYNQWAQLHSLAAQTRAEMPGPWIP